MGNLCYTQIDPVKGLKKCFLNKILYLEKMYYLNK